MTRSWPVFAVFFLLFTAGFARADGGIESADLMAADKASTIESAIALDGTIRITPDKTKIVRLDQDAVSVIVTNPDHASVVLDSPRLLIVMPRQPGTTSFTVLNNKGETILERTVIVSSMAKPRYVRIRRVCSAADSSCVPVAYFYCPDGCYEVAPVTPSQGGQTPPILSSGISAMSEPSGNSASTGEETAPSETPSEGGQ